VLQQGVSGEHTIVRLYNGGRHLGRRVHGEAKLRLFSVVHRQALKKQTAKARSSTPSDSIEHKEPLQASAVVRKLSNTVKAQIHNLLADCNKEQRS
jgi:hypothetical protein